MGKYFGKQPLRLIYSRMNLFMIMCPQISFKYFQQTSLSWHFGFSPPGFKWMAGLSLQVVRWPPEEKKKWDDWARQSWTSQSPAERSFIFYVGKGCANLWKPSQNKQYNSYTCKLILSTEKKFHDISCSRSQADQMQKRAKLCSFFDPLINKWPFFTILI